MEDVPPTSGDTHKRGSAAAIFQLNELDRERREVILFLLGINRKKEGIKRGEWDQKVTPRETGNGSSVGYLL